MHIYEYLFTAIIILAILLGSSTMIATVSEPSRSVSEKEQLKVAAQKLMAQILLDPGDPPDWGGDITIDGTSLKNFGLAMYSETTREAYVLDPDKVLRLDSANPLFISPSRVVDLLNLGHEYGFALEFYPALNVNVNKTHGSDWYEVSVSSEYGGLPIVGANVVARMYYYNESSQKIESTPVIDETTSYEGKCSVNFDLPIPTQRKILSLVVDYYGVHVAKVVPAGSNVTRAYLLGSHLYGDSNTSGNATEIMVIKKAGGYTIESVTSDLSKVKDGDFRLTYVEPSTVAVLAISEDRSRLVFASREATLKYSSIPALLLKENWSFPFAYSVERSVIISGSAYIVRLYLWRMSF